MALVETNTGTTAALTIGTPTTLATPTAGKTYQLTVDLNNMTATDVTTIITLAKAKSGGTLRQVRSQTISGVPADPIFMGAPYACINGLQYQILQSAGTGRTYDWSVVSLD
jgi:hypothetical protein